LPLDEPRTDKETWEGLKDQDLSHLGKKMRLNNADNTKSIDHNMRMSWFTFSQQVSALRFAESASGLHCPD